MLPIIEESANVMAQVKAFQELDLSKPEDYNGLLARIFGTVSALGNSDTAFTLYDLLDDYQGGNHPKEMRVLVESFQTVGVMGLYLRVAGLKPELRKAAGALNFAIPTDKVRTALDKVLSLLSEDELDMSMRSLLRASGFGGAVAKFDLGSRAARYASALTDLRTAINDELSATL